MDLHSECPSCSSRFPSNDLTVGDFSREDYVDDGFGYFDTSGHIFLFAASSHRDLANLYISPIHMLTNRLRLSGFDVAIARQLGLMLLRYAVEEIYLAAVPQSDMDHQMRWRSRGIGDSLIGLLIRIQLRLCTAREVYVTALIFRESERR